MSIYNKLLAIQHRIIGLGKDKKGNNYDYVTGNKLMNEVKPMMNDLKLLLKQEIISIENVRQDYTTRNGSKSEINSKVMMRFTWIDCETGETDVNSFGANGQNDWDKGVGSALTYGERYFLLKYFHIATDEDDIDNPDRKKEDAPAPQPQKPSALPAKPATETISFEIRDSIMKLLGTSTLKVAERAKIVESLNNGLTDERIEKCIEYIKSNQK